MHHIALAGVKHSGKSTKGRLLAEARKGEFFDLDDLIEALLPEGYTVRRWYLEMGQEAFRERETLAVENYLKREFSCFSCLALGGGTLENPAARELLKSSPLLLCGIEEEEDVLFKRILRKGLPPFLDTEDPAKTFHELYERRSAGIREFCDIITPMNNLTIQEAVDKIDRDIRNYRARETGA